MRNSKEMYEFFGEMHDEFITHGLKLIRNKHGIQDTFVTVGGSLSGQWAGSTLSSYTARRIVACWNACKGVSTESLEDRSIEIEEQPND